MMALKRSKMERECFSYLDDLDEADKAVEVGATWYMPALFDITKERAREVYEQWLEAKKKAA